MDSARQLVLSDKEYSLITSYIKESIYDGPQTPGPVYQASKRLQLAHSNANIASLRAAIRVYVATSASLKGIGKLLTLLRARRSPKTDVPHRPFVASVHRLSLSLSALLFFHRTLYRLLTRLRLELLHEKVRAIKDRWPRSYSLLTSRYVPAIGAGLSGLALGICPKDQLRVTIAIYVLVRVCELAFKGAELSGRIKTRPWWFGSWILFALAQGQLFHSFVFEPECFPRNYGDYILNNSTEYLHPPPATLSKQVAWPSNREIVDSIAQMSRSKWPPFLSPTLKPNLKTTLPSTITPAINPIVSQGHPLIQHLSCALLHPSGTSCFPPYLRQLLASSVRLGRFFTIYYSAFSIFRLRSFLKEPLPSILQLAQKIAKVSVTLSFAIAGSWASICFFNNYLPPKTISEFRFVLGGALAGCVAILDRSATAHENTMIAVRTSIDSLWKVGTKRRWWKGIKGGDVYVFVAALVGLNVLCDRYRHTALMNERTFSIVRLLRGDTEVGLSDKTVKDE